VNAPTPETVGMAQSEYESRQIAELVQRAVKHAAEGTTDWTSEIYRLPVELYSPRSWGEEMDAIFRRLPLMLALSTELRSPGAYKAMKVLEMPVLIVRGEDGVVRAFINACRHRGRAVTQTADECGHARSFVCPYHAWRFGLDGTLIAVSDPRKFGEVDKSTRPLVALPCEERVGFIWVGLTPGRAFNLDQYLGGMLDELTCLEADKWFLHGTSRLESANWKITHDGYLEGYHIPFLHRDTLYPMWKRESSSSVSIYDAYGPLDCGPHQRMAGNAWGYDPVLMGRMKDVPPADYKDQHFHAVRTIFPHISISADKHGGMVSQLFPVAPDRCITIQNHVNPRDPATHSPEENEALQKRIALYAKVVRDEDYSTSFSIQEGLAAGANQDMLFGRNEGGAQNFHRAVAHYVDAYRRERDSTATHQR
jgi:phenylpropionate dioxygenase-like ring-hydroxylating dioxygenase large terminal subunit